MRRRALQAVLIVLAVTLAGVAVATADSQPTGVDHAEIESSAIAAQDDGDQPVEILSPDADEDFNRTGTVPIELDFGETETATATIGEIDADNIRFDATVRNTGDSTTATVYFTPDEFDNSTNGFSAGEGAELVDTDGEFERHLQSLDRGVYDLVVTQGSTPHYDGAEQADTSEIRLRTQLDREGVHFFRPVTGSPHDNFDQIPIELELRGNETATVTVGELDEDDARLDVTVRDTEDSDSAIVYFTPVLFDDTTSGFSAGEGTEIVDTDGEIEDGLEQLESGFYELFVTDGSTPHYDDAADAVDTTAFRLGDRPGDPTSVPPQVRVDGAAPGAEFSQSDEIPLELEMRNTSTAAVTIGDSETAPIQLDAIVRDTDDSGSAMLSFTPSEFDNETNGFSAGEGAELIDTPTEVDDETFEPQLYQLFTTPGSEPYHESDIRTTIQQSIEITDSETVTAEFETPAPGEAFDQTERIPLELDLQATDTGTITVGDIYTTNARFDATARDTDDSGSVTVYFTPAEFDDERSGFSAGEGTELIETDGEFDERFSTLAAGTYDTVAAPGEQPHHADEARTTDRGVVSVTELVETVQIEETSEGTVEEEVPIELDLRATDTGTVTLGKLAVDNVRFDATVRDIDGSGTATLYFAPDGFDDSRNGFSAGDGAELVDTDAEHDESLSSLDPASYDLVTAPGEQPHHAEAGEATDRTAVELTADDLFGDTTHEADNSTDGADETDDADDDGDGFGLLAAALAIGSLLVLARRRD